MVKNKLNVNLYGSLEDWFRAMKETATLIAKDIIKNGLTAKLYTIQERQALGKMIKKLLIDKVIDSDVNTKY